ncbi:MAG TPA: hypothetical protein VKU19_01790 [Bryobacteraceae bacterium]|nr:hypothetical protein [Bryobacteraceae bacterium]
MRNGVLISVMLAVALTSAVTPSHAATFGAVVPIGGHASDIALDESRGVLYIANFTANRIEVMSLADGSINTSMNVAAQPGAISISPDNQFLLVAHFGNVKTPATGTNALTLINLNDGTRQTFTTGDTPLGLAFLADGTAMVVTSSSLLQFDPVSGLVNVLTTFAALATQQIPAKTPTFPTQIILAQVETTPDRTVAYGVADDGSSQAFFRYDVRKGTLYAGGFITGPKALPRLAVAADGSWTMVGQYKLDSTLRFPNQFPNSIASVNIGANAVDSKKGILYSQILTIDPSKSSSSSSSSSSPAASQPPVLYLLDADNLTIRDTLSLPENLTGRAVLNANLDTLYAVSDSGVTVMPVGRINQFHRVNATQSDVLVSGNFCDRNVIVQTLTITDPGGGNTDFAINVNQTGVTISPSSGITPATVQVRVDPNSFQNQNGTVAIPMTISSGTAINIPKPLRLLVNNRNPDQRGTVINVPGTLVDVLPDPKRNHFYVIRQDLNQVLVFDSTTFSQVATLRTGTTPTGMAITMDQQYLLVGHDNSQFIFVFDLDTLAAQTPIEMPSGHYPRQVAVSGKAMLSLVRDITGDAPGAIDRIDFANRKATELPTLGVYVNNVDPGGVLAGAPNGGTILAAMPDGTVMLYDANADTFTIARKDYTALSGGFAASSYNTYVVGQYLLNASLVTQGTLETSTGTAAGFAFVDTTGLRTTTPASASPGVIQRVDPSVSLGIRPTRMVESPLTPTTIATTPLLRSLAPLFDHSAVISLSVSGFMVLPWSYDAAVAPPKISSIVNAADGTKPVAPGGLISVYGQQMSPVNMATSQIPLPTALGESCLTVNGLPVPMLFVSSSQINGQLPFNVSGNATMTLRTPGGISDNFNFSIFTAAPSIFRSGTAGPETGLATIYRADNNQLVTPTNPLHPNDEVIIYATGLGLTQPSVDAGLPSPSDPLGVALIVPQLTLGGVPMTVDFAGLVAGEVGVYQINARVPAKAPQGLSIPLVVNQSGVGTTLSVRVVNN